MKTYVIVDAQGNVLRILNDTEMPYLLEGETVTVFDSPPALPAKPNPTDKLIVSGGGLEWSDLRTLDEAKADQLVILQASRDAAMDKQLTTPHGKFVHDEAGRDTIEKAQARAERLTAKGEDADVTLTTADDLDVTLDVAAIYDVWNKSDNRVQDTLAQYRALRSQVKDAATIEAVTAVVWT